MSVTLGIHVGHNAACAIVRDGELMAGIAQERLTRVKHDGEFALSNRLPVRACLSAAGVTMSDIDLIVSSFQAAGPGGVGLDRSIVEASFDAFDVYDSRHHVISHHLAHAHHAWGASGFVDATVLVVDLGGSSTVDGGDFEMPFMAWARSLATMADSQLINTENLSIYATGADNVQLVNREYCVPHSVPEVFVTGVGSLYDNVSRAIFSTDQAHGQLMALAALCDHFDAAPISERSLLEIDNQDRVVFRNDWQQLVEVGSTPESAAWLARAVQNATEAALLAYCRRARRCTQSRSLAMAGGVFLNIIANSAITRSGLFDRYYVPSAPNDAGVAAGCAYWGDTKLRGARRCDARRARDRVGPFYSKTRVCAALDNRKDFVTWTPVQGPDQIAELLAAGNVIARWFGRSEFGPRALGGRSILGSPLLESTKRRLNKVKGRQQWRPVAPVVAASAVSRFFTGPPESPYMNFSHMIRAEMRTSLAALRHPDGSTRAQTLDAQDDKQLYEILIAFERLTGFPILANTSMNGPGEPMVETPEDAIQYLLAHERVDVLILDEYFVRRRQPWISWNEVNSCRIDFDRGAVMTIFRDGQSARRVIAGKGAQAFVLEEPLARVLVAAEGPLLLGQVREQLAESDPSGASDRLLFRLLALGVLTRVGS